MANYIKSFITAKSGCGMDVCDDHYAFDLENLRFAVSDGASCNLGSRIYSRLLVDSYAASGKETFSDQSCCTIREQWRKDTEHSVYLLGNPYYLTNMLKDPTKVAAATFVGLQFKKNDDGNIVWNFDVIGDSVLLFFPRGEEKPSIVLTTNKVGKDFGSYEDLKFSNSPLAARPFITNTWTSQIWSSESDIPFQEGCFCLMTDALAEWFLCSPHDSLENKYARLLSIGNQEEFVSFVAEERERKLPNNAPTLHDDDVTLMILNLDDLLSISSRNSIQVIKSDYRQLIERDSQRELVDMKDKIIDDEKQRNVKLTTDLESAKNSLQIEKDKVIEQSDTIKRIAQINEGLQGKYDLSLEDNKKLSGELSDLEQKNKVLKEQNETLSEENRDLKSENHSLRQTIELMQKQIEECVASNAQTASVADDARRISENTSEIIDGKIGSVSKVVDDIDSKSSKNYQETNEQLETIKKKIKNRTVLFVCVLSIMIVLIGTCFYCFCKISKKEIVVEKSAVSNKKGVDVEKVGNDE